MVKPAMLKIVFIAGCISSYLFSMDNNPLGFSRQSVMGSIQSCCDGEKELTGRSQLRNRINQFVQSTSQDRFLIPNIPVIRNDGTLCLLNVALVKNSREVDLLDGALAMMAMSEDGK
jgi:hypothetical protein